MLSALEPVRYLAYRAGFRHAPWLLRRAEELGHRLRNRELERSRFHLPGGGSRPVLELVGWDGGFVADLVRVVEDALGAPAVRSRSGVLRAAEARPALPANADVTLVEVPEWHAAAFSSEGWFVLPKRVTHLEPLGGDESPAARRLRRASARAGLRFDVSRSSRHLAEFHERLYLPMVERRHAARARPTSRALLSLVFRDGFLVRVFERGAWVSGAVVSPHPTRAGTWSIVVTGVRDGDYARVSETARAAAVLHARDAMMREGATVCDHLVTRPFPEDGLFRRKRTWNTRVEDLPERPDRVALRVNVASPAARALLGALPFVALAPGGLAAVAWAAPESPASRSVRRLGLPMTVVAPPEADAEALGVFARSLARPGRR